jgi:CIC family chloride channel protein
LRFSLLRSRLGYKLSDKLANPDEKEYLELAIFSSILGAGIGLAISAFILLFHIVSSIPRLLMQWPPVYVLLPVIGIPTAYGIVHSFSKDRRTGCGTHKVLEAYHVKSGFINISDAVSRSIASSITIGLGGSAGLEGPSLLLGGGLASWVTDKLGMKPHIIRRLMLAGSAAGLSAVFKAPLTAILFALEIPYKLDIEKDLFIPALCSSIPAYLIASSILGWEYIIEFKQQVVYPITPWSLAISIMVGLASGLIAVIFIEVFTRIGSITRRISNDQRDAVLPLLGGLILSIIWLVTPEAMGIGYDVVGRALSGAFTSISYTSLIILAKIIATSITLNFGGSGGLFIPSIVVGALLGNVLYLAIPRGLCDSYLLSVSGMAALMAASNKTLLASIAFVAETCGPRSIIPATISASISYMVSGMRSLYGDIQPPRKVAEEERALEELYHIVAENVPARLSNVKVEEVMTKNPIYLTEDITVEEALRFTKNFNFRVYPVVDKESRLIGYVRIEDLISISEYKRGLNLSSVSLRVPTIATPDERFIDVVERMCEKDIDHIYVVSSLDDAKLVGVISGIDAIRAILSLMGV